MSEQGTDARNIPPPLRIHHLMTWMAATAALISICLWFDRTMRNGPPITNGVVIAALVMFAIAVAGALNFAAWGLAMRKRGHAFPLQPGDWLVLMVAVAAVWFAASVILSFAVFFALGPGAFAVVWVSSRLALLVGLMVTCVGIARPRSDTAMWRAAFLLLAAVPVLVWAVGATAAATAIVAALNLASWSDWRRRMPRSWMHWIGVILVATLVISCGVISLIPTMEHSQASGWLR